MNFERAACVDDLRKRARRRLPRFAFDLLDGGAEDERNLRRNREAFEAILMTPRYLVDVSSPSLEVELFGERYAVPFGIAPVGLMNLFWPGGDLMLAKLASQERMPLAVSSACSTEMEIMAEAAEGYAWFQLYVSTQPEITENLIGRAKVSGFQNLLVTVDIPSAGKRDRDIRNGLKIPFRMTPRMAFDLAMHPIWSFETLRQGRPKFANYREASVSSRSLVALQQSISSSRFDWEDLKALRDRWPHKLLVKGLLHPDDASEAVALGADGIVVSNHGGRQVAYGPASIEALPAISNAIGGKVPLLLDSGVRRGEDVVRAKALGAEMVFLGKAFGYGLGAGAAAGIQRVFDIIKLELSTALGQLGCPNFSEIDHTILSTKENARI